MTSYYVPRGGLPGQTELASDRTRFTAAYALLGKRTMRDIVTSRLPFWENTRLWVLARPLSGFAETFLQYVVEVGPRGGSEHPETDSNAEAVLFVVGGAVAVTIEGAAHELTPGGYAYIPPGSAWTLHNHAEQPAFRRLHVAARVLPPGMLRGWPGAVSLPALQGRQPPRRSPSPRPLSPATDSAGQNCFCRFSCPS